MRDTKKSKGRKRKEKGGGKEAWVRWLFSMWVHDVGSGHLKTTNIYRVGEGTMNDDQLFSGDRGARVAHSEAPKPPFRFLHVI